MKKPEQVRSAIATRWTRSAVHWLAHPEQVAISIPLDPPSGTAVLADPAAVNAWIQAWSTAPKGLAAGVLWQERRLSHVGTQRLPVRWEQHEAAAVQAAADEGTRREWIRLEQLHHDALALVGADRGPADSAGGPEGSHGGPGGSQSRPDGHPVGLETPPVTDTDPGTGTGGQIATAPDAEKTPPSKSSLEERIASALLRRRSHWLRLGDVDAALVLRATAWFLAHPASGLRIRQVPLEGMHTKWLAQHRSLVTGLLAAIRDEDARGTSAAGLGLAPQPHFHDLVLLDPALRPPTAPGQVRIPRALRVDLAVLGELEPACTVVIVCENSETTQVLPDMPGAVAISGEGFALNVLSIPWVQQRPILYWGDIDAAGLRILDRARHHHPRITSVLMDAETLGAFGAMVVDVPAEALVPTSRLTGEERAVYEHLARSGVRLEQERIELGHASDVLRRAVEQLST